MTARTSSSPGLLEFELANGDCVRLTLVSTGVVGEFWRNGSCLMQARFLNFAAAGRWIDAEVRLASPPDGAGAMRELFAP